MNMNFAVRLFPKSKLCVFTGVHNLVADAAYKRSIHLRVELPRKADALVGRLAIPFGFTQAG